MANEWADKAYSGSSLPTKLTIGINNVVTSLTVETATGWLDGTTGPFVIAVDRTTLAGSEEKMLCTSRSGNILVVERGYDGTNPVPHGINASVEHVLDAFSMEQANAMASAARANGSMSFRSGPLNYSEIPLGTPGLPLVATPAGPAFQPMTIAALAASLVELLTPAGTIADTISATAPPGWLLLNGQTVVNAQSLYPALWTASPTAWKSGANLVLPNGAARVTVGTDGNHPLGNAGGASGKTITAAHLPQHNHDINHDHGAFTSGPESAHTHGGTTNLGGTHNHGTSAGLPGSDHSPVLYFLGINSAPGAGKPVIGNGGTIQAYADYFDGTSYAPDHTHGFGTSSNSGHSHSIDVPPLGVTNSGGGPGTNAAFDVEQSWIAVNKIIKAH